MGRIPRRLPQARGQALRQGQSLTARMIDRPIRPVSRRVVKNEVHVVATTFVCDGENPPDTICVAGASAALSSAAPFDGPRRLRAHRPRPSTRRRASAPSSSTPRKPSRSEAISSDHRGHRRLHLHGGGRRPRDLRRGHAGRHDVRPGGHRRVLREAEGLPRQGRSDPDGLHHPRRRSFHRDACRPLLRPDGRRPQRRRQALRMGKVEISRLRSRRTSSATRSALHGAATLPPPSRPSRSGPCAP